MDSKIYKVELSDDYAVIYLMTTKGAILKQEEVSISEALRFARLNGLAEMESDGCVKLYW